MISLLLALAPALASDALSIPIGRSVVVETPAPIKVSKVGRVARLADMPGGHRVHVIGLKEGEGRVELLLENGVDFSFPILVTGPSNKLGPRRVKVRHGAHVVITLPRKPDYIGLAGDSVGIEERPGLRYVVRGLEPGITDLTVVLEGTHKPQIFDFEVESWETWPGAMPVARGEQITLKPPFAAEFVVVGDPNKVKARWDGEVWTVRGLKTGPTDFAAVAAGQDPWVQEIVVVDR